MVIVSALKIPLIIYVRSRMKRGRIDREGDRHREIPESVTFQETTDTSTATPLLSNNTSSCLPNEVNSKVYTTFGDTKNVPNKEWNLASNRIPWHESWANKIETRRSGASFVKTPKFLTRSSSSGIDVHPDSSSTWRMFGYASMVVVILALWNGNGGDPRYQTFMPAEWHWDHNIYAPTTGTSASLIAQVVPGTALHQLGDISTRPNRAYARQWGLDFARYDSGRSSFDPRACFEKVAVLNELLDRQSNETSDGKYSWQRDSIVEYESILLLPVDAIVMELDTDIFGAILPLRMISWWQSLGGMSMMACIRIRILFFST